MWRFYTLLLIHFLDLDKVNCGIQVQGVNQITVNGVTYKNGDANMPFFNSNNFQKWVDGNCIQVITASGQGVKDEFEGPCTDGALNSYNMDGFTIIGDPSRNAVSIYKDDNSDSRLRVVRNGRCTVRSYTTTDGVTTYTESPMNEPDCSALKKKMTDEIEKNRVYWENWQIEFNKKMGIHKNKKPPSPPPFNPPPPTYPPPPPTFYSPPPPPFYQSPPTPLLSPAPVQHIALWPNQNGQPQTPTYNMQNGNEEDVSSPTLTIRSKVLQTPGPCKQEISAVGNGVKDTFIEPCTHNGADSAYNNGITVFGDPNKLPFCLFSEKRNTLIVVKKKVCTLKTYKTTNGVTTSTKSPMSIGKCSQIRKKMSEALKSRPNNPYQQSNQPVAQPQFNPIFHQTPLNPQPLTPSVPSSPTTPVSNPVNNPVLMDSTMSPTVTYRPADNRVNSPDFIKTTNNYNNDGYTTREFIITGLGLNDYFKYNTQAKHPNTVTIGNIFGLRERNGELGLFTDKWGEMWVFENGKCFKRTYETSNGQTKITSTPMKDGECQTVRDKMTKFMGGQSPQIDLRPQPITSPVQQAPATPASNPAPSVVNPITTPTVTYRPVDNRVTSADVHKIIKNNFKNGQRTRELTIVGRGLNDHFQYNCAPNDLPNSVTVNNIFRYSEQNNDFGLFSDTWGELWVFQSNKCSKRTYETMNGQTKITTIPMKDGECATVKDKLTNRMGGQSPQIDLRPQPIASPVQQAPATPVSITYRPADHRINNPNFSKTTNNYNNDGYSTHEVILVGRGINDYYKYNSQAKSPGSVTINNVFGLRDSSVDFGLFTDTWGELWVFENDKCFKRTYQPANGQTKITSTPMKSEECSSVKAKLINHVGGGGGQDYNLGRGQQNVNLNNNQNINWNNNQNMNWNNNQNMNWNDPQDKAFSDWETDFDRRMAEWERDFDRRMAMF